MWIRLHLRSYIRNQGSHRKGLSVKIHLSENLLHPYQIIKKIREKNRLYNGLNRFRDLILKHESNLLQQSIKLAIFDDENSFFTLTSSDR